MTILGKKGGDTADNAVDGAKSSPTAGHGGLSNPRPLLDEARITALKNAMSQAHFRAAFDCIPHESARILNQIKAAIARGDLDGTRRGAHSLNGMAANIGAERLAALARDIEVGSPTIEAASGRLAHLEQVLEETCVVVAEIA